MGKRNDYICVDLETTGLNPGTDRMIEIGAVFVHNGQIQDTFEALVYPGMKLPERVTEITGITDAMLQGQKDIHEVIREYAGFERKVSDSLQEEAEFLPILGHAVHFDYAFLKRAFVNEGLKYEREGIDTLKIARHFLGGLPSRSLCELTRYYGIDHQAHRAVHDAKAAHRLYERMWEEFGDRDDAQRSFSPVKMQYHVKRQSPVRPRQKERLCQLAARHNITLDVETDSLTRNEADRMIDRILLRYGR